MGTLVRAPYPGSRQLVDFRAGEFHIVSTSLSSLRGRLGLALRPLSLVPARARGGQGPAVPGPAWGRRKGCRGHTRTLAAVQLLPKPGRLERTRLGPPAWTPALQPAHGPGPQLLSGRREEAQGGGVGGGGGCCRRRGAATRRVLHEDGGSHRQQGSLLGL